MFKNADERNNIIYHFKPLRDILQNSEVEFKENGNICFKQGKLLKENVY